MGAREVGEGTSGLGENPGFGVKVGSEESVLLTPELASTLGSEEGFLLTPALTENSEVGLENGVR